MGTFLKIFRSFLITFWIIPKIFNFNIVFWKNYYSFQILHNLFEHWWIKVFQTFYKILLFQCFVKVSKHFIIAQNYTFCNEFQNNWLNWFQWISAYSFFSHIWLTIEFYFIHTEIWLLVTFHNQFWFCRPGFCIARILWLSRYSVSGMNNL